MMKNIVVVGQGAIGLLWYYHLSQQPNLSVSLLTSSSEWQKNKWISYSHFSGFSINCSANYAEQQQLANADLIIFCLKAYQIQPAIQQIQPRLSERCIVVLSHNGMGVVDELPVEHWPQPVCSLLTTHGSFKANKRHIIHTGLGHSDLGLLSENNNNSIGNICEIEQLTGQLNNALPTVSWHNNIKQKQWQKLMINCVINPITAIDNIKNGELLKPRYQPLIEAIIAEIELIATKEKLTISAHETKQTIMQVAQATSENCSSMRADCLAHRKTEIDYINGYLVKLAQKHQIDVPVNKELMEKVNALSNHQ